MMLLPVTKREMVRARVTTVMELQLLQLAACLPFMLIRAQYGAVKILSASRRMSRFSAFRCS